MRLRAKKGAADMQLNWAFVLVAGAIIFALFAGIIAKERNISGASKNALMLKNLDSILSSSESASGNVNAIAMPNAKIEFGCNNYAIGMVSKQFNAMSVFAPSALEGDKIITMALGWGIPYRAANLVYAANPLARYIFIGNSDFARNIFEAMPEEINTDGYTTIQAVQDEGDKIVRLIFFGQDPEIPESLKGANSEITALKVEGDENTGLLEFFGSANGQFESKGKSYYIKESTLIGAIFADNPEGYNCAMKNAFKKLNIASRMHQKKANALEAQGGICAQYYNDGNIKIILDASDVFDPEDAGAKELIGLAAKNLEAQNKNAQEQSCSLIY